MFAEAYAGSSTDNAKARHAAASDLMLSGWTLQTQFIPSAAFVLQPTEAPSAQSDGSLPTFRLVHELAKFNA